MEEKHASLGSSPNGGNAVSSVSHSNNNSDHGWQKVTYAKRQRKAKPNKINNAHPSGNSNGIMNDTDAVFRSLERQSEDRRRRILEAQRAANAGIDDVPFRSKQRSDYDDELDGDDGGAAEDVKVEDAKKVKAKKEKKPKVTVAEAAAKIDADALAVFLADITMSYEQQQEIQLMRFADYFGRAFSAVSSSQFPWMKLFRESAVAKIVDVPLSHISDAVYKTSVDWISQRSPEALSSFVLWSLDSILVDLASQQAVAKGSKKGAQQATSKSQVAIFVVLAMVLRRKPDALIAVLPTLRENSKYQGQDKLSVIVWMIGQASVGDLSVGLYAWARNLLPIVSSKSGNPLCRDLVLQLVEKILCTSKARSILLNSAVRKGERLIPPSSFEILMRLTFPVSSARVKATERFEAIYHVMKEVALAGSHGSKAMKQTSQQIFKFAIKAAGESNPGLSKEAAGVIIWCLSQSTECYKQWESAYEENLEASISVLKKLCDDWKEESAKLNPREPLRQTLKNFKQKNEKALASDTDVAQEALYKDADKYCKIVSGKASRSHGCLTCMTFTVIALAMGAVYFSPNLESWDFKKLSEAFSSHNAL
ncbi:transmembrane protein 214-B-like [Senna tora]|uniref:Transmembrane protein 214-B-like n=1 Tax=Senna tora TaxID=362788 RepID=A0A834TSH8_9FABA|nr:transmembrane protein 214-B-like [Senna tora]